MSVSHIITSYWPSLCEKLSKLLESGQVLTQTFCLVIFGTRYICYTSFTRWRWLDELARPGSTSVERSTSSFVNVCNIWILHHSNDQIASIKPALGALVARSPSARRALVEPASSCKRGITYDARTCDLIKQQKQRQSKTTRSRWSPSTPFSLLFITQTCREVVFCHNGTGIKQIRLNKLF